jgi:homoserine kinase
MARAFAPASVSNVGCGFDALGFALDARFAEDAALPLGDTVEATTRAGGGVTVVEITGDLGKLPREADRNTAAGAAAAVLARANARVGLDLRIQKHMPLRSGLGSSAASAVAAAVAADGALGAALGEIELLECALAGEQIASGTLHADNIAPSLLGGLVLVRSLDPRPDVVRLPVPPTLLCVVVRPDLEVDTRASRRGLGDRVALPAAVAQWSNLGALVAALFRADLALIARALEDSIAEPVRGPGIPGYFAAKQAALDAGALAANLSGSGPSLFALCTERDLALRAGSAAVAAWQQRGIAAESAVSMLGARGARVLPCD